MNFIKTTIIGGLVFLVPVVALVVVIAKVFSVMTQVAEPMVAVVPLDSIGGVAIANIVAALTLLLVCFVAGLIARAGPARRLAESIESAILAKIPGYALVKRVTGTMTPEKTAQLHPVLVSLGYSSRVGLEMEKIGSDRVSVYLPGSPNAWSGEVHVVNADQVERLDKSFTAVLDHAEQLGLGSHAMLCGLPESARAARQT